jgi:peptidoglycan/LPS O-acetylase OafA/YrhL
MEKRIYFKNLNALRFFAALMVILHHVEQYKRWVNLPNIFGNVTIDALGHKAVSFFFVLSGFLITYLLLTEDKQTGDISVRNFYVRRILRIWPLYYLIVILCLFVVPNIIDVSQVGVISSYERFGLISVLLLLVLPNVVILFAPTIVGGNQLWSIGVEEQFYLVWPLLVRWFIKHLIVFLLVFIALKFLITVALDVWVTTHYSTFANHGFRFWKLLQIEQMAIGAIGAWILFNKKESFLTFIYHKAVCLISILLLGALFFLPMYHWSIKYFESIIFIVVILNLSTSPSVSLSMETKSFTILGNISYGIYMYHTLCITICLYGLRYIEIDKMNYTVFNILLHSLSIMLTIGVAYLSYEIFEKKFLNFKERFMIVKSGKKENSDNPESDSSLMSIPVVK